MIRFVLVLLWITLLSGSLRSQECYLPDPSGEGRPFVVDVEHLDVSIAFREDSGVVVGRAELRFTVLPSLGDSLVLAAPGFTRVAAQLDGLPVPAVLRRGGVALPVEALKPWSNHTLTITYQSEPAPGREIYFIGWNDTTHTRRRQIWSHRPAGWVPYPDERDRVTASLTIAFDTAYQVFANGELQECTLLPDGKRQWRYAMTRQHPLFSTCLAIGRYQHRELVAANGTPLEQWFYPDLPGRVEATYRLSPLMFSFLEKELGVPYPYPLYRQAPLTDYPYGAMETTTATVFNDRYLVDFSTSDSNAYLNVNCHELVHQWLGNYVSHLNPRDVWITESTATYYAKLFEREVLGHDRYDDERLDELLTLQRSAKSDSFPLAHSRGGVGRWYDKGSMVLGLLRHELGDSAFKRGMQHYLTRFGNSMATSHDLIQSFELASGRPLKQFADQWIFRGHQPRVSVRRHPEGFVQVMQSPDPLQPAKPFVLNTTLLAGFAGGEYRVIPVTLSTFDTLLYLNAETAGATALLLDPDRLLPVTLSYDRAMEELVWVMLYAPSLAARYEALDDPRLDVAAIPPAILSDIWSREQAVNGRVRNLFLQKISRLNPSSTMPIFRQAAAHPDEPVRRTLATLFDTIPGVYRELTEQLLADPSPVVVRLAADRLAASFPGNWERYSGAMLANPDLTDHRGRIVWLCHSLLHRPDAGQLEELKGYTTPRFSLRTRQFATLFIERYKLRAQETGKEK